MKQKSRAPIELLSPAANPAVARAAINAGADAIYIGGPRFGAREGAANSMEQIAELVQYAHTFGVRIYMTMNTILFESELAPAERLAHEAYRAGVDALIVQDMAFAMMDLPPIALHASTQTCNISPERIRFLEECGFERVVLERGATLEQIRAIRRASGVELEVFVHGAICVSHSGACYLGHALCGRGGNRGGCAQACRSRYNLLAVGADGREELLYRNQELLSVRDLDLSQRLDELIEAGAMSLKIEGRLKDEKYVVNNTAHYDTKLRELGVERCSSGHAIHDFTPDPSKSFTRGFTSYFLDGAASTQVGRSVLASTATGGERIGKVLKITGNTVTVELARGVKINNGDGVCFADSNGGGTVGTNVNTADGNRLVLNKTDGLKVGAELRRNFDRLFSPVSKRQIDITLTMEVTAKTVTLSTTDSDGVSYRVMINNNFEAAANPEMALSAISRALQRSGGTVFRVTAVELPLPTDGAIPFMPSAATNELRRRLLDGLASSRLEAYCAPLPFQAKIPTSDYVGQVDYRGNVSNSLSERFYTERGIEVTERAPETTTEQGNMQGREVMISSYCLRAELGMCLRNSQADRRKLLLENNGARLELHFDCAQCRMSVIFCGK